MNLALVYASMIVASLALGITIYVRRHDGRVTFRRIAFFDESVPRIFWAALKKDGIRALARGEMMLFALFFFLIAFLLIAPLVVAMLG